MDDHAPLVSAGIAFYILLTAVPMLLVLASVYGLVADPSDVARAVRSLSPILPRPARPIVFEQLHAIAAAPPANLSVGLVLSFLLSTLSASSGTHALLEAINLAYNEEDPSYLRVRARALLYTFVAIVVVSLSLGAVAAFDEVWKFVHVDQAAGESWPVLRWTSLVLLAVVGLTYLFGHAPTRPRARVQWRVYGAFAATIIWLGASVAFAQIVELAGGFSHTYGALAGVIVLMLWLYVSSLAILVGAELNSELEHQTTCDTTVGSDRPMGDRGAFVADRVGPAYFEGWRGSGKTKEPPTRSGGPFSADDRAGRDELHDGIDADG